MIAVPGLTPRTLPVDETVATDVSLLVHVTALLVASSGATVAFSSTLFLASTVVVLGETVTPVTETGSCSVNVPPSVTLFPLASR